MAHDISSNYSHRTNVRSTNTRSSQTTLSGTDDEGELIARPNQPATPTRISQPAITVHYRLGGNYKSPSHVTYLPRHLDQRCDRGRNPSLDDLVGACEHGRWDVDAGRLCSLEIDNQLVFGRRLDRQVGWLLAS